MTKKVQYMDWGLRDYQEAWEEQSALHRGLIEAKRAQRTLGHQGHFILCEHPAVYTLGKSGKEENLLVDAQQREQMGLQYYKINRGGDITHHGPGQIVGYPILDLEYWYRDVHRYVRNVEEVIIQTLDAFDIEGLRVEKYTGVWTRAQNGELKKLCAIGVHLSRWVSMHGFALNVCNDLSLFQHIIPCGIQEEGMSVTSMSEVLFKPVPISDVKAEISTTFARVFECESILV